MASSKRKKYKSKNKHSNENRTRSQQPLSSSDIKLDPSDTSNVLSEENTEEKSDLKTENAGSASGIETVAMFFNDTNAYIEHFESVLSLSQGDVRVNVVIKSQDNISTQKVPSNIFLYTGEVWWNIHKNREQEGYYKKVVNIDG